MPITYLVDRERRIVFTTWTGRIGAADLSAYFREYAADAEALAYRRGIQDMRDAEIVFTGQDLQSLTSTLVLPVMRRVGRATTAFIVNRAVQFGSVRQWEAFGDTLVNAAIFEDIESAMAWLLLQPIPTAGDTPIPTSAK